MNTIKEKRLALGMSQRTLAEAVRVSQAAVQNWEHGKYSPPYDARGRLCAALGCSEESLRLPPKPAAFLPGGLRERRLAAGLSQRALGEMVGAGQKTVKSWEHGVYAPDAEKADKLCEVFHCSLRELGLDPKTLKAPRVKHQLSAEQAQRKQANREKNGEYLERRKELGLTQQCLAERAGVSKYTVVALEVGRHLPTWESRQKIRRALGMPEERFYTVEERNALFMDFQGLVCWMVGENLGRIRAVHADPEDFRQDLMEAALRAIDHFRPDGGASLTTFVAKSMQLSLKNMLGRYSMQGLSGKIQWSLPDIHISSLSAMLDGGFQFDEREDWDESFMYEHEENRPW